jgi:L-rhamnose mutarotase
MIRHAFRMKLKPGAVAEYKKRHDEIWPDLAAELKAAGISDYGIFLDEETLTLFAVLKLSEENTASALPGKPTMQKWWGTWHH